jgi:nucleotide-binding universal stress UspA family protein
MLSCFKKIIVPADFSVNTEIALKKAVELADEGATIHLLHVSNLDFYRRYFLGYIGKSENPWRTRTLEKLSRYKNVVQQSNKKILVKIWIVRASSTQNAIENKAKNIGAELIVIGKKNKHNVLPFLNTVISANLARRTSAAVLTVKPGAIYHKLRTIIVPIANKNADRKLEMVAAISKKFPLHIHLVTFIDSGNKPVDFYASSLLRAFQWLKTSTRCQIEYSALHGRNRARVLLDYAKKSDADILLVNPETETKVNWLNAHISDMLPPTSKVEILAVRQETLSI